MEGISPGAQSPHGAGQEDASGNCGMVGGAGARGEGRGWGRLGGVGGVLRVCCQSAGFFSRAVWRAGRVQGVGIPGAVCRQHRAGTQSRVFGYWPGVKQPVWLPLWG